MRERAEEHLKRDGCYYSNCIYRLSCRTIKWASRTEYNILYMQKLSFLWPSSRWWWSRREFIKGRIFEAPSIHRSSSGLNSFCPSIIHIIIVTNSSRLTSLLFNKMSPFFEEALQCKQNKEFPGKVPFSRLFVWFLTLNVQSLSAFILIRAAQNSMIRSVFIRNDIGWDTLHNVTRISSVRMIFIFFARIPRFIQLMRDEGSKAKWSEAMYSTPRLNYTRLNGHSA